MWLSAPWGLLLLTALPVIVWLHRHVARVERRTVSHLPLWASLLDPASEGPTRRSPPWTLVLLLELLAATALVATAAGAAWRSGAGASVGVVVDTSLSMSGGPAERTGRDEARAALQRLRHTGARVILVASGPRPRVVADGDVDDALTALDAEPWVAPGHDLQPAVELLASWGLPAHAIWVLTDEPTLPQAAQVGAPAGNTGLIAATWGPGEAPFLVVGRFGDGPAELTLEVTVDDYPPVPLPVTLDADGQWSGSPALPPEAARLEVALPGGDALAGDDRVTLLRPVQPAVSTQITLRRQQERTAFERAVAAIPTLQAGEPAQLVIRDEEQASDAPWQVVLLAPHPCQRARQLSADPYDPLMRGFDPHDLVWYTRATTPPPTARVLLRGDGLPLVWRDGRQLVLSLCDAHSYNLFRRDAFIALMSNLADELVQEVGGLPRTNLRQGEDLRLRPLPEWGSALVWRTPSGVDHPLRADGDSLQVGPLVEPGVHELRGAGESVRFAVQPGDPRESDLTGRRPAAPPPLPEPVHTGATASPRSLADLLLLLALAALLAAWFHLDRAPGTSP